MKYEVWRSEDAWTIFPVGDEVERAYLEQTATLTWTVEACSYNEVIERYYAHMGWDDLKEEASER